MGGFKCGDTLSDDAIGPIAVQHSQRPLDVLLALSLRHVGRDLGVPEQAERLALERGNPAKAVAISLECCGHDLFGELLALGLDEIAQPQYEYGGTAINCPGEDRARPSKARVISLQRLSKDELCGGGNNGVIASQ